MKNFTFTALLVFIVAFSACVPSAEKATKYNNDIINLKEKVDEKYEALLTSYESYVAAQMDAAYNETMVVIDTSINFTNSLKPFEDDASLKDAALALFNAYKSTLEVEQKRVIELLKLPESQYKQEQVDEVDSLRTSAYKKIDAEESNLGKVQEKFAKKFEFKFEQE